MHIVSIWTVGEDVSHSQALSIDKDNNISCLLVAYSPDAELVREISEYCADVFLQQSFSEDVAKTLTEILEDVNIQLDLLYTRYPRDILSLFVGIVSGDQLHFSVFGKKLTGIISSARSLEDIFNGMDSQEGRFVYDSHGAIHQGESIYIFSPKIDTHLIDQECRTLHHLPLTEQVNLITDRLNRTHHTGGKVLAVALESLADDVMPKKTWQPQNKKNNTYYFIQSVIWYLQSAIGKMRDFFVHLSHKAQNILLISGLVISIWLLYFILSGLMKSQYTVFVPQKYKDMIVEARGSLDTAARSLDQPEQFNLALNQSKELLQQIKDAHVLEVNVEQIENEMALLEKTVNKVVTPWQDNIQLVYSFSDTYPAVPFSLFSYNKKQYFISSRGVTGPLDALDNNQSLLPGDESMTYADIDSDGRIYFTTDQDKVYLYEKGNLSSINVSQVGWWDKAAGISVYNSNIYLLSTDRSQIFKHRRQTEYTYSGKSLLVTPELEKWSVISMDIDGSIWLLSWWNTLTVRKILTAPRYEQRDIIVNGLWMNTFKNFDPDVTKIYVDPNLSEIYLLADNRIWVFTPNSKRFTDVRSITYVWQIDVPDVVITDLAFEQEWDTRQVFFGSPKSGIFSIKFTLQNSKIEILN